jgi:hypothetical protein
VVALGFVLAFTVGATAGAVRAAPSPSEEPRAAVSTTMNSNIVAGGGDMVVRRKNASYATGAYEIPSSAILSTSKPTEQVGPAPEAAVREPLPPVPPPEPDPVSAPDPAVLGLILLVLVGLAFVARRLRVA